MFTYSMNNIYFLSHNFNDIPKCEFPSFYDVTEMIRLRAYILFVTSEYDYFLIDMNKSFLCDGTQGSRNTE